MLGPGDVSVLHGGSSGNGTKVRSRVIGATAVDDDDSNPTGGCIVGVWLI